MKPMAVLMLVLAGGLFLLGMGAVEAMVIMNHDQKQYRELRQSLRSLQTDVSALLQKVETIEKQVREDRPDQPHPDCPPPMVCR